MKRITLILALLTVFAILSGCKNDKNGVLSKIELQFKDCLKAVNASDKVDVPIYMIIPRAGCSSCISGAESFMLSCIKDPVQYSKVICFILTDFDSEKTLRVRYGDLSHNKMIVIDRENIFKANKSLKSIYPTILFFDKNSNLKNVSECSPSKDGISDIKTFTTALNL